VNRDITVEVMQHGFSRFQGNTGEPQSPGESVTKDGVSTNLPGVDLDR
jgi:hypothetical protein